jgi:hypothetical protein
MVATIHGFSSGGILRRLARHRQLAAGSVEGSQLLEAPEDRARIEVVWRLDT